MDTNKETRQNEGTVVVTGKTKEGFGKKVARSVQKVFRAVKRAANTKIGKVATTVGGLTAAGLIGYKVGQHSVTPAQITIKTEVPEEAEPLEETAVEEPELGEIQEEVDTELSEL